MKTIVPCRSLRGSVQPPGDKSIAHRYGMLGAIAVGDTEITNYPGGRDVHSTLSCMRQLGIAVEIEGTSVRIHGRGLRGLQPCADFLDVGNSGTTIRLLSGILAGQGFTATMQGDDSIRQRPMRRILVPLRRMGAAIQAREDAYPPLSIQGKPLQAIHFRPDVPSAQVKSCVLLAGLYAEGTTQVTESVTTRNHTELALAHFGADLQEDASGIKIRPGAELKAVSMHIPGDISSAVFWILGALLLPGSEIEILHVGLNPSRNAVLDLLRRWGADLEVHTSPLTGKEISGTLTVRYRSPLGSDEPLEIGPDEVPLMIDEIPALAVLGAHAPCGMRIRGAAELRVKESDRLQAIAENLLAMGVPVKEFPDGLDIEGGHRLQGAALKTQGDHRIAMAFTLASLGAQGSSVLDDADCASVSYPDFYRHLELLAN